MAQLVKTLNGLAIASVKTWNGLAIASAKTINGLDNTAGGGGFAPTDLSGLVLWLKGDAITGLNNGDPVTTWLDLSGNANNASASGSTRPTYITAAQNGLAAVRFGGPSFAQRLNGALSATGTGLTVCLVGKLNSSSGAYNRLVSVGQAGTDDYGSASYADALSRDNSNEGLGAYRNNSPLSTKPVTYGSYFCATSLFDGTNHTMFVNGSAGSSSGTTGSFGITAYCLGDHLNTGNSGDRADGDMGELCVFNRDLTGTEQGQMETYLKARWGTP